MTWRPWVVSGLFILAVLLNGMLLVNERIPSPEQVAEVKKIAEPLRTLQYLPSTRRANFQAMGMSFELAEASATFFGNFDRQAPRFRKMIEEQAAELTEVLCATEGVPQPYAALAYLVYVDNDARLVVDPLKMRRFERQPWYDRALVPAMYDQFERTESRKPDATLMAISAVLLDREAEALNGVSPWQTGLMGTWGFTKLEKKEPRISRLAIEYFSLMHFLVELANEQAGICS
jgi:hypothetical protein